MTKLSSKEIIQNIISKIRHDLTNPINAIIGYSELLLDILDGDGLSGFRKDVDSMISSGKTLLIDVKNIFSLNGGDDDDWENVFSSTDFQYTLRISLTTIIGLSEFLIEDKPYKKSKDCNEIDQIMFKIIQASKALLKLINDLNDYRNLSIDELIVKYDKHNDVKDISSIGLINNEAKGKTSLNRTGTILIIDDEPSNLEILTKNLTNSNHEVIAVSSVREAENAIQDNKDIDVILLDLIMPEINGIDYLKKLKSNDITYSIPVIMLSALDEVDAIVDCINAGAEDFLMKPVNRILLMARLNNALEKKYYRDKELKYQQKIKHEQKKSDNLLLNILPSSTADRLKDGETLIADDIEDATVLFADIPNFTSLSNEITAKELVLILNRVFSEFDEILNKYSLEKIKTIGDNYMLAGGIPNPNKDHATSVALMAIDMVSVMPGISDDINKKLNIRIGMNSGPLSAGVIGKKKFVYDLWGDTVNVASRMETSGESNKIHVSESTFKHLKETFNFTKCDKMEIPGKGVMQTYFLNGRI
ncbi:MAG: adenylate/guanylate cyclase domain-containing protein [Candidatus Neomarinimicrobiota bacterium]|nr:adenylate/guanylate cyclase domain-containing protein [Candidatus Neomarinimicrobiota bacterium]